MADYWKSQAKKFCDFCKCWIADNKPSIGFHDSGKRHKENVAKRLAEISKNSAKTFKEEQQVDREMKKMEEEALKAYMKDLQENPDYTSKKILEDTERKKKELEESLKPKEEKEPEKETETLTLETSSVSKDSKTKVWYEAKSDEGYSYYWNTETSESKWEPPENYVSLEEQEKEAKLKEDLKRRKKEEKAKLKKEKMALKGGHLKKKRKNESDKEEETIISAGPAPKPDPYGAWTLVEPKVEEPLDLELPQQEYVCIKVPEFKEPEVKFKEKTVISIENKDPLLCVVKKEDGQASETFKKRKLNKGNMRQKLDTD